MSNNSITTSLYIYGNTSYRGILTWTLKIWKSYMIITTPCLLYYKMIHNCQWHLLATTKQYPHKSSRKFWRRHKKHLTSQWKSKQPISETPEVTCTRGTDMGFLHERHLIWVISPGGKIWLVHFRPLHICKSYHINAKYMIKGNIY